jgi:hypothetical protein
VKRMLKFLQFIASLFGGESDRNPIIGGVND